MKHNLIEIYSFPINSQEEAVVRWCRNCGAVVIDVDFDGRTMPGDIIPMMTPIGEGACKQ